MEYKILLVDDEPNILEGFKRQLRNAFKIETAMIQRFKNHAKLVGIREPLCVDCRVPAKDQ